MIELRKRPQSMGTPARTGSIAGVLALPGIWGSCPYLAWQSLDLIYKSTCYLTKYNLLMIQCFVMAAMSIHCYYTR